MNEQDLNDEAIIRLGVKCMEDLTITYLSKHNELTLQSYRRYLKHFLANESWLRSAVDPDEVIDCMERVRREKLRTDEQYKAICQEG